jgi:radical SAM-linked protein
MIGLPTETEEDLVGIANIIQAIFKIGQEFPNRKTINVTLSPFIPKAHTPFQWDEASTEETVGHKIGFIKRHTRINQVSFKVNNPDLAILSTILGRGGRSVGKVIEAAYRKGCRFDGWSEDFHFNLWLSAMSDNGIDVAAALRAIPFSADLPWSHIEKGRSLESLVAERQRTSVTLRDYTPMVQETPEERADSTAYGRNKKKVVSRNVAAPTKNRARLRWGKTPRYRFMSHLDNLRMIERALRRAKVPVSYSQGFNPTPKLSFGPPLPLGFTSEAEYVDITLDVTLMAYMIESLRKALPEGFMVSDAKVVLGKTASLSSALNRVRYELARDCWQPDAPLQGMIESALAAPTLVIERPSKDYTKPMDIRPAIYELTLTDDKVSMLLGLGEAGYARPTEVAQFLTTGLILPLNGLPFHRREMYRVESNGTRIDAMDL